MQYVAMMLVLAAAAPTPADEKAVALVKESIKATGGAEVIDKLKCSTMKAKGEMAIMGFDVEFTGNMAYSPPDKYKMTIKLNVGGQNIKVEQVMNGKKLKSVMNGNNMEVSDTEADNIRENMAEHEITRLTPLLDGKTYKIKLGDEAEVDGKKTDVLIVSGGDLKDKEAKLFFDKETRYLVKMQRKSKEPGTGGEVDEEQFLTDYKKVDGIMTPHKYEVKHDGKKFMTMTMSEVKMLEKIDDKEFAVDD